MLKRSKHISLLLLLPVIMLFQFVQLGNMHYHELSDGSIIKHAHLYDKSDNSNQSKHKHSSAEFFILSIFDVNSTDGSSGVIDIEAPEFTFQIQKQKRRVEVKCFCFSNYSLRGPPVL